jgi:hypothetical protein
MPTMPMTSGVILRDDSHQSVHGLTTAACHSGLSSSGSKHHLQ